MGKSRLSEEQIVGVLQELDSGAKIAEVCRRHGVADAAIHRWRQKYGGLQVSDARRLKALELHVRVVPHQQLELERREATLSHCAVVTVALRAHARHHPVRGEFGAVRARRVLRPRIRMMNQPGPGAPRLPRHPQRAEGQLDFQRAPHRLHPLTPAEFARTFLLPTARMSAKDWTSRRGTSSSLPRAVRRNLIRLLSRTSALFAITGYKTVSAVIASSIVAAFVETVGLVSILPFMSVVTDPAVLNRFHWLTVVLNRLSVHTHREAVIVFAIVTVGLLCVANAVTAANIWLQHRFMLRIRGEIARKLYSGYLDQPYTFFLDRSREVLANVILEDISFVCSALLLPITQVLARMFATAAVFAALVALSPVAGTIAMVSLLATYALIYRSAHRRQGRLGVARYTSNYALRSNVLSTFRAFKELRVLGREQSSVDHFAHHLRIVSQAEVTSTLASAMPRLLVEMLIYTFLVALTVSLFLASSASTAITLVATLALAGYRIMPAVQQAFAAAVGLRFHYKSVTAVLDDFALLDRQSAHGERSQEKMPFRREIVIDDVSYRFRGAATPLFDGLSFRIRRGQRVAITGRSGIGKSTFLDILLGLLAPTSGTVSVDGASIHADSQRWQNSLGFVPQEVCIKDATIAENVALGIPTDAIDDEALRRAAKLAQASEFIATLPLGFNTTIGSSGVQLSGGQKQRIALARALYRSPSVLVLDEPTSSLDVGLQDRLIEDLFGLSRDITIIIVSHSDRVASRCDLQIPLGPKVDSSMS